MSDNPKNFIQRDRGSWRIEDLHAESHSKKQVSSIVTADLFTIKDGPILLKAIVGHITTVIESAANAIKLQHTETGGSAVDLCAALESNAAAKGKLFSITGTKATAMALSSDVGIYVGPLATALVLTPGVINLHAAGTTTGAILWYVTYVPLAVDARIVPA